jgi:hypothetical protein
MTFGWRWISNRGARRCGGGTGLARLARGASTEHTAVERLRSYLSRYAPVAKLAGMADAFAASSGVEVIERYPGTGSTDFWGSRSHFRTSTSKPWQVKHWSVN